MLNESLVRRLRYSAMLLETLSRSTQVRSVLKGITQSYLPLTC